MTWTRRIVATAALAAGMLLGAPACSDDGGGSGGGAEGTYVHAEEGTIVLADGGKGTWTQEGNAEPFEFTWSADGATISLVDSDGEDAPADARIEDGDLVLPPELISGDEDVVFEKQ